MATSPFAVSISEPGKGRVHLSLLPPNTPAFTSLLYSYPLKLVSSTPHKLLELSQSLERFEIPDTLCPNSVPLLFLLSYGGGLLPPDSLSLDICLDPHTRLTLTTQGSTKIFPSPDRGPPEKSDTSPLPVCEARQTLNVRLKSNSALLLSPDPTQPFRNSNYSQNQIFEVSVGSSLGLLDWVTSGRPARGEVWDAGSWKGRNEIWRAPLTTKDGLKIERKLLLRDSVILADGPSGVGPSTLRTENIGVFGTLVLYGPIFKDMGEFFISEFSALPRIGGRDWGDSNTTSNANHSLGSTGLEKEYAYLKLPEHNEELRAHTETQRSMLQWRHARVQHEKLHSIVWTAARVRGLVLIKFSSKEVEGAREWLGDMWKREGTVPREFGPGGMMSLR